MTCISRGADFAARFSTDASRIGADAAGLALIGRFALRSGAALPCIVNFAGRGWRGFGSLGVVISIGHSLSFSGRRLPMSFSTCPNCFTSSMQQKEIAVPSRPARPVRPMRWTYASGLHRHVVVDDVAQTRDVDAAGGNIRRDEDFAFAGLECGQRGLPGVLALIAVDGDRVDALALEIADDAVCAMLRAAEHERVFHVRVAQDFRQQSFLFALAT